MSDYLWDKTGEPEEDVAQLENLLGALKHRPRPLEIPADAIRTPAITATRPATIFSRPRLAIAASLILTLLAGAWFVTRQGEPRKDQLAEGTQSSPAARSEKPDNVLVPNTGTEQNDSRGNKEHSESREDRAVAVVAASVSKSPRRAARSSVAKRQKLLPRVKENAPAPLEEVAQGTMRWQVEQPLTPQQREATEQLMFALRLASAKLNYAQREMQDIGRAGN
ncbi:MAG TPA: hypothetical protein VK388_18515 [Pyrinomonadaceae bacterium]|nr:hypothetical protein [Pyrinomonadaceae bacterium]